MQILLWVLVCLLIAPAIGFAIQRKKSSERVGLLRVMEIAMAKGLPLTEAIEAYAAQCGMTTRRRALRVAGLLRTGVPLPEILQREPGLLPLRVRMAIRASWHSGDSVSCLEQLAHQITYRDPIWSFVMVRVAYLYVLVLIIFSVLAFLAYYIVPRYRAIFDGFGVELGQITQFMVHLGAHYNRGVIPLTGLVLVLVPFLVVLHSRPWFPSLPLTGRWAVRLDAGLIMRTLAIWLENGRDVVEGIESIAGVHQHSWVKSRLQRVSELARSGQSWTLLFTRVGVLKRAEAAVLDSALRVGNVPWALRELAASSERRVVYHLRILIHVISVVIMLGIGVITFLVAAAYFLPLVKLIEELS